MTAKPTKGSGPAGYACLVARHRLKIVPNWHESVVVPGGPRREAAADGSVLETYLPSYWPGNSDCDHLEFALKYDGTNLAVLSEIFKVLDADALVAFIKAAPFGKYRRRLWYLYETIAGHRLPLVDMTSGNYVDLVPEEECFTAASNRRVPRQRINDNLLGNRSFCPMIRRTAALEGFVAANLAARVRGLVADYPHEVLHRALAYLYTKETKSSFAIEHEEPTADRTERFATLLGRAARENWCEKPKLVALQNAIVDSRFSEADYRTQQNWVGESVTPGQERVHYVCPRPVDVPSLMEGLIETDARLRASEIHPVLHAAAAARTRRVRFRHARADDGAGRLVRLVSIP